MSVCCVCVYDRMISVTCLYVVYVYMVECYLPHVCMCIWLNDICHMSVCVYDRMISVTCLYVVYVYIIE